MWIEKTTLRKNVYIEFSFFFFNLWVRKPEIACEPLYMGKENITGNVSFPHERCFSVLLRNNRKQNIQTTVFW